MSSNTPQFSTVDEYINSFPQEVKEKLQSIQQISNEEIPNGEETITYGVPTIKLNGKYVVYFAAYKKHIAIYPISSALTEKIKESKQYFKGKGTLQIPLNKELPLGLIREVVVFLLKEHRERNQKKK